MKILLVTGNCPYNYYQEESLQLAGLDANIFGEWGMHMPHFTDEMLALKPDIIHLQWPEAMTAHEKIDAQTIISDYTRSFEKIKAQGIKIFWTQHNSLPHARTHLDLWKELYQVFAQYTDVACHHSQCGLEHMCASYDYGDCEHIILHHGYFHKEQSCTLSPADARQEAGLPADAHIYLGIGALRPDKCIRELIDCFKQRDPKKDVLLLAGSIWNDYGKEMVSLAEDVENIIIDPGFIEEAKVSLYANASDAFLYMYGEHHLTSGSPHLSQAHILPQITLDYQYAHEVLGDASSYIAADEHRYEALHTALDSLSSERLREQKTLLANTREPWSWTEIAQQTKAAYEKALGV